MDDFRVYSPEDIIAANLREAVGRYDRFCEQETAHLRELAIELAGENSLQDLLTLLPDYRPPTFENGKDVIAENADILKHSHKLLYARQRIVLCTELYRELSRRAPFPPTLLFSEFEEVSPSAYHRIVYQRSIYADAAYLRFSPLLTDARAAYAHSFHAACEDVYNGHYEFCILPIENAVEGQLISFSRLIAQYDLKIAASCDVVGTDSSRNTRFALLHRNMLPTLEAKDAECGFFRFSIPHDASTELSDVLMAASFCGLRLHSVNTLPPSDGEANASLQLSFYTDKGLLQPFLLYLAMEIPHYTPIGMYPHLPQKGN